MALDYAHLWSEPRVVEALITAVEQVPAIAALGQMINALVHALRGRHLARLAVVAGLPYRLPEQRLRALARQRAALLRVSGGSRDGGSELFVESRFKSRSSSSTRCAAPQPQPAAPRTNSRGAPRHPTQPPLRPRPAQTRDSVRQEGILPITPTTPERLPVRRHDRQIRQGSRVWGR